MEISLRSHALSPIAVVGISAELPSGAHSSTNLDFAAFKELLLRGQDVYEKFPRERINIQSWKGSGLGQIVTDTGAFLKDLTLFDHLEFGVSAKEAKAMAVGTRKLLEQSFLALLDSGIDYRRRNVGCYVSAVGFDINTTMDPDEFEARGSFAGAPCMIANRISYYLDLLGPSIPVDTACSSSLTALHLAVQAIRNGECDAAVVGGSQINHSLFGGRPIDWINYSQGGILSKDGKCKPFDASADGFGRGEGTIAIVLKPLADAIRNGDHIYCSILGTGINSSGCAAPVSAPVAEAQKEAMYRAYSQTDRLPVEVDFVELHATGTAVGDPTEANWVGEAFQRDSEILVGSVKGNMGHLEITAFLASLAKVCTIFQTGIIPPNVNFKQPNPAIKWDEYNLRVVSAPTRLLPRSKSGCVLVSIMSSGIGGSNGHAVIEGPPSKQENCISCQHAEHATVLLFAAGLTPRSVTSMSEALLGVVRETPSKDMPLLSTVLGRRAKQMTWRSFAVVNPHDPSSTANFSSPTIVPRDRPPLAFLFSGQGPQYVDMGRQLFTLCPVFRETILCLDRLHESVMGHSLMKTTGLFSSSSTEMPAVWPISVVLPAIAMLQIALVDLLSSLGITPDIVLGHSAGETAMLYASGAASKEMAFSIAVARATAMGTVEEAGGTMASLSCSPSEAQIIIDKVCGDDAYGKLEIACYNGPRAVTLSGLESCVEAAVDIAKGKGLFATKLRTCVPVHSSIMERCEDKYRSLVFNAFEAHDGPFVPKRCTYSSMTGKRWDSAFSSEYFWQNARQPVRFSETVSAILSDNPNTTFLEVSSHPVLSSYVIENGARPDSVLPIMRRSKGSHVSQEHQVYLSCLGQLVSKGYADVDFAVLNQTGVVDPTRVSLPPYPFIRRHIPYLPDGSAFKLRLLNGRKGPMNDCALRINAMTHPILAQHVIRGEPILPAAGYLEMLFESGAKHLWNVDFRSMLSLSSSSPVPVMIDQDGFKWSIKSQLSHDETKKYRIHAEGYLSQGCANAPSELRSPDICAIMSRCQNVSIEGFYDSLRYFADYGPAFQRVVACYKGKNEVLAHVRGNFPIIDDIDQYVFHPALLDSCFHVAVHGILTGNVDNNVYYLPSHIDDVYLYDSLVKDGPPDVLYVHVIFRHWNPDFLVFDFNIHASDGPMLCSLIGFKVASHQVFPRSKIAQRFDIVQEPSNQNLSLDHCSDFEADRSAPHILHFEHGCEMQLKEIFQEIDRNESNTIWISSCLDSCGAGSQGFSRSLRREVPLWDIHLISLPRSWTISERRSAIQRLWQSGLNEAEIIVDDERNIFVPRISVSSPPQPQTFDPHSLWYLNDDRQIVQTISQVVPGCHSLVSIESTSLPDSGLRSFVGRVLQGDRFDSKVVGITADFPLSNYAVIHNDQLAPIIDDRASSCGAVLGLFATSLALGVTTMSRPARVRGKNILITNVSSPVGRGLTHVLSALAIRHDSVDTASQISRKSQTYDIIISGFLEKEDIQLLNRVARSCSSIFMWNDPTRGLRAVLDRQSWAVADALIMLKHLPELETSDGVSPVKELESILDISSATVLTHLFDPLKVYLLIGGVGSLGMRIAVFMYKHGARKIVMTSRNGIKSSSLLKNENTLRELDYLRTLPDLALRIEECDATSHVEMKNLISSIDGTIGGCMLLSALLSDRTFFAHTAETYFIPFEPKVAAFRTLERVVDIAKLDFLITFSSGTIFGNAGQTNYSSANTLIDELIRPYRNAFSIVAPLVFDSTIALESSSSKKQSTLLPWGVTSDSICDYIEDGLLKLADGPFWLYIPDMDWATVERSLGPSSLYSQLVKRTNEAEQREPESVPSLREIVLAHVDVRPEDLSPVVPLTSYGLDSISAARLSFDLRPLMSASQLQLLANISLEDLELKLQASLGAKTTSSKTRSGTDFSWTTLNKSGETIVKLRDLDGIPLILIHGADGNLAAFRPLQEHFSTPLWAIQTTPETPRHSIQAIAKFYFEQIKKELPNGPYRIAGFSGTSLITFELVRLLESNDDTVAQLAFLDHFPMLFCSPIWTWDDDTVAQRTPSHGLIAQQTSVLCTAIRGDQTVSRHNVADALIDALNGKAVSPQIKRLHDDFQTIVHIVASFLLDLASGDTNAVTDSLKSWMQGIKTPFTVYVASKGIRLALPLEERASWADFEAHVSQNAKVVTVDGDHYGFLESEPFIRSIESGWER